MSRTLEEDFILAQNEEALEEALESGIHVTREHVIGAFLYMARKMLASGIAFDDVVEAIPEEYREEVSERLDGPSFRASFESVQMWLTEIHF
ncbi:MAG: hypothetical protein IJ856_01215 [Candidatus Methanomethylophilaceae archaeon]|nr:hypothetical protein [Candidatus Methanomethylophilaceae archaeon]